MSIGSPAVSGVRARTRLAILTAAMKILPRNPAASIHEIADAASVGRSTVHRYFPDRASLIEAMAVHIYALSNAGIKRADISAPPALAALRRLAEEQLDLGLALDFIYNEQLHLRKPELFAEFAHADHEVDRALEAAARPGQDLPERWRTRAFWALLRLGAEFAEEGVPRHQIMDSLMETLSSGILRQKDE